jgi:NAD-dependent SIR2 family protein deacetylase
MIEENKQKEKKVIPHCRRCGKEISEEQEQESIKKHWIPLCSDCEPEIKEKFKKWHPLFQKFKL